GRWSIAARSSSSCPGSSRRGCPCAPCGKQPDCCRPRPNYSSTILPRASRQSASEPRSDAAARDHRLARSQRLIGDKALARRMHEWLDLSSFAKEKRGGRGMEGGGRWPLFIGGKGVLRGRPPVPPPGAYCFPRAACLLPL